MCQEVDGMAEEEKTWILRPSGKRQLPEKPRVSLLPPPSIRWITASQLGKRSLKSNLDAERSKVGAGWGEGGCQHSSQINWIIPRGSAMRIPPVTTAHVFAGERRSLGKGLLVLRKKPWKLPPSAFAPSCPSRPSFGEEAGACGGGGGGAACCTVVQHCNKCSHWRRRRRKEGGRRRKKVNFRQRRVWKERIKFGEKEEGKKRGSSKSTFLSRKRERERKGFANGFVPGKKKKTPCI